MEVQAAEGPAGKAAGEGAREAGDRDRGGRGRLPCTREG